MLRDPALAPMLEIEALVSREAELETEYALRDLPRVAPLLLKNEGAARVHLRFTRYDAGERRFAAAEGRISATLALTCQRCLEAVAVPVEAETRLMFVADEADAEAVPASHDAVVMSEGRVLLPALVEDELLLALPLIPAHPAESGCGPKGESKAQAPALGSQRPFAALRDLMKN